MKSKNALLDENKSIGSDVTIQNISIAKWTEDIRHCSSSEGERVAELLLDNKPVGSRH